MMPPSRCGARGRLEDDRNGDAPRAPLTHRYALARYARAQAELGAWRVELLALDFIFDRAPRSETWEGWGACTVVSAGRTDGVAAARAARARGAGADAIIASSPAEEVLRFVNLHLADAGDDGDGAASSGAPPRARLAMTHDYNGIPFGPFTRRARRKRAAHRELLAGWTLLCDSRHLAEYVRRHAARERVALAGARVCYGAAYHYFAAWVAPPPRAPPPFYDVAARAESAFATVVSPCPAKGLALLRALAARLPRVPFAAVCTGWTNDATRLLLRREGVTLLPAALAVDDFYRRTKVLLVPSVWPEAYGLVATEAALRGIPVVSTDVGGVPEANPLRDFAVRVGLVYDAASGYHRGTTLAAHEARLIARETARAAAAPPPPPPCDREPASSDDDDDDRRARIARDPNGRPSALDVARARRQLEALRYVATDEEVAPLATLVERLFADDSSFLRESAARARAAAEAFVARHRDGLARLLQDDILCVAVDQAPRGAPTLL